MAETYYTKVLSVARESFLDRIPIEYGQIIFVKDTRSIYYDTTERTTYRSVVIVETEEQRQAGVITGLYYVIESRSLWFKNGNSWDLVCEPAKNEIYYADSIDELPEVGDANTLYIVDLFMYRWKDGEYKSMGSATIEWIEL
jgi:hypothetical protein